MQLIDSSRSVSHYARVNRKRRSVKPTSRSRVRKLSISDTIGAISLAIAQRCCVTGHDVETRATANVKKSGIFPPPDESVQQGADTSQESLSASNGKIQPELRVEDVRNVLLRRTVVLIQIGQIEIIAIGEVPPVCIARVHKQVFR